MARRTYEEITLRKNFYRNAYRRTLAALMFSAFTMLGFVGGIYYLTVVEPTREFFASQSAGIITKLTPLNEPNASSEPLLKSDPVEEMAGARDVNLQ